MEDRLRTPQETEDYLTSIGMKRDVDYFIATTPEARELYNDFVEKKDPVGALMHSTC